MLYYVIGEPDTIALSADTFSTLQIYFVTNKFDIFWNKKQMPDLCTERVSTFYLLSVHIGFENKNTDVF